MNKVVDLWFERKQRQINEKYSKLEQDFINKNDIVKKYNTLIDKFAKDLEELYLEDKATAQFVLEELDDENSFNYDIDCDKLSCDFTDKHIDEKRKEFEEIAKTREEVEALLSLSNDLDYQQSVLIEYNIIDKKTKRMITNE